MGIFFAGALEWVGWTSVLIFSGTHLLSAWAAAGFLLVLEAGAVVTVIRGVGSEHLDRAKVTFAAGMLVPLFLFDVPVEASVPGILLVAAGAAYLLYRLLRVVDAREGPSPVRAGPLAG